MDTWVMSFFDEIEKVFEKYISPKSKDATLAVEIVMDAVLDSYGLWWDYQCVE